MTCSTQRGATRAGRGARRSGPGTERPVGEAGLRCRRHGGRDALRSRLPGAPAAEAGSSEQQQENSNSGRTTLFL
ncbi:High Affinity Nerve Growth Factor Receptor [Manis pentadactyla]|nr:High Affinity Nerve Growth Factor Receptor [Manis pentadactyla]